MISGQYGIGYFTWEAYSLVQYADIALGMIAIGVARPWIEPAYQGRRAFGDAVEAENDENPDSKRPQGPYRGQEFSLSYDSNRGTRCQAVTGHADSCEARRVRLDRRTPPAAESRPLLQLPVAGFLKPTTVQSHGRRRAGQRPPAPSAGMVFQQYSLFPLEDGAGELSSSDLKMRGMGGLAERERAGERTRASGSRGSRAFGKSISGKLSGGMKQRVGIVRALATGRRCCCSTSRSARSTRRRASSCSRSSPTCGSG
jgi:hypothetical protein